MKIHEYFSYFYQKKSKEWEHLLLDIVQRHHNNDITSVVLFKGGQIKLTMRYDFTPITLAKG